MGGSSSPVSKISKKIKKVELGDALKNIHTFSDPLAMTGAIASKATGGKHSFSALNVAGNVNKAIGNKYFDDPKKLKKEAERFAQEQAGAQAAHVAKLRKREAQEGAEKSAADKLAKGRKRQDSRKKKKGRAGTILTGKLGSAGGEGSEGLKTILGA